MVGIAVDHSVGARSNGVVRCSHNGRAGDSVDECRASDRGAGSRVSRDGGGGGLRTSLARLLIIFTGRVGAFRIALSVAPNPVVAARCALLAVAIRAIILRIEVA